MSLSLMKRIFKLPTLKEKYVIGITALIREMDFFLKLEKLSAIYLY